MWSKRKATVETRNSGDIELDHPARSNIQFPAAGTLVGVAVLVCVGYGIWNFEQAKEAVADLARPERTTTTEVAPFSGTEVMRTPGGVLEVARIKAYERLTRRDTFKLLKSTVDLGTTVSEIDVAVLFRYHIELAKEWPIVCNNGVCVVQAGTLLPSLPPAIYSDEVRKRTESGWARFNKDANLEALERSLTNELSKRATSDRNLTPAIEAGRKTVEEFARTWMVKHRVKPGEPMPRIVVLFPGEKQGANGA
ncbi:MAG: hypothetical protein K0Q43_4651 [Ramlibacter sp.]|jgi:hypothetical protein|nr:hypothetical protein [Ramlibacter sp.]